MNIYQKRSMDAVGTSQTSGEGKSHRIPKTLAAALTLVGLAGVLAAPRIVTISTSSPGPRAVVPEEVAAGAVALEDVAIPSQLEGFPLHDAGGSSKGAQFQPSAGGQELEEADPASPVVPEPAADEDEGQGEPEGPPGPEASHDPCQEVKDAASAWLAVVPDPVQLKPGDYDGGVIIHNCGQEDMEWSSQSKPSVALSETSGSLQGQGEHELGFTIDETKFPAGPFTFKIKVSRPGQNVYVDVNGSKVALTTLSAGDGGNPTPNLVEKGGKLGGCATQCITKAWLTPNASNPNMGLEVKTRTPAKLSVYLDEKPPHHGPSGRPFFPGGKPKASSGDPQTLWTTTLQGLAAGTRYHIIVKAVDNQGGISYREGTFKTLRGAVNSDAQMADRGGPSGCATQCIKVAKVSPADRSARLDVTTVTGAQMRVKVATQAPKQGSNGPLFLDFDAWADSGTQFRKSWNATLTPLEPDTLYHIGLWATDDQGRTSYQQGKFRTRRSTPPAHIHENRAVRVTFHKIHVSNDADNGGGEPGKGELSFDFFVEGEYRPEMHQERRDIKSGQTVRVYHDGTTRPGMYRLLQQAPNILDLRIYGEEKDSGTFKGGCVTEAGSEPHPSGAGRDGCEEWNNAEASVDLHNLAGALSACPGFGIAEDACLWVKATGEDPTFEVLVSLEFIDDAD